MFPHRYYLPEKRLQSVTSVLRPIESPPPFFFFFCFLSLIMSFWISVKRVSVGRRDVWVWLPSLSEGFLCRSFFLYLWAVVLSSLCKVMFLRKWSSLLGKYDMVGWLVNTGSFAIAFTWLRRSLRHCQGEDLDHLLWGCKFVYSPWSCLV